VQAATAWAWTYSAEWATYIYIQKPWPNSGRGWCDLSTYSGDRQVHNIPRSRGDSENVGKVLFSE